MGTAYDKRPAAVSRLRTNNNVSYILDGMSSTCQSASDPDPNRTLQMAKLAL
jgi:hypothetical protein